MNIDYQILDRLNNVPESEDFVGEVPYEIAVAKDDSENIDARMKSAFEEQDKIVDEFVEEQEDESRFVEPDKKYEPKKLTLSESLFEDYEESLIEHNDLDEAWTFDEPTNMGRGQCAPLCPDYNDSIDDALRELDDEEYADLAKRNLRRYLHELFDKKEEVENFNTYWTIRYPACIDFLDEQIEKIPEDIRKMVMESCDCHECKELKEESTEDAPIFKPKKKRDPLADIIQDELTIGEYGYRRTKNGTYVPANGPSVGLDVYDIGVDSDDKGYFIVANVANEDKVNKVIEVANKYSRNYVKEKGDSKRPYRIKIYMKEEDFDQPYIA